MPEEIPLPKPEKLSPIQEIEAAFSEQGAYVRAEKERLIRLEGARRTGESIEELERPVPKNEQVKLAEEIAVVQAEAAIEGDRYWASGKRKGRMPDSINELVLETQKGGGSRDKLSQNESKEYIIRVAEAKAFALKNAGEQRSWAETARLCQAYPEIIQDRELLREIVEGLRYQTMHYGPRALREKPDEPDNKAEALIKLLLASDSPLEQGVLARLRGYEAHLAGMRMLDKVDTETKIKMNSLDAVDLEKIISLQGIKREDISRVMGDARIPFGIGKNVGIILAKLSRSELPGLDLEAFDDLQRRTVGYAEALLLSRPANPEHRSPDEERYNELSLAAAQTLAALAGPGVSLAELRNGKGPIAEEVQRILESARSKRIQDFITTQHVETLEARDAKEQADEEKERLVKETEATRLAELKEAVKAKDLEVSPTRPEKEQSEPALTESKSEVVPEKPAGFTERLKSLFGGKKG